MKSSWISDEWDELEDGTPVLRAATMGETTDDVVVGNEPPTREDLFEGASGFEPVRLGRFIEREARLRVGPDGKPWRYVNGVYRPDGGDYIAQRVRDILGEEFRANRLHEVTVWCEANTSSKLDTEPTTEAINLSNGLLYWKEDPPRLVGHSPDAGSVI